MNETNPKGKFITVEGIEGVGKSSNITFMAQILKEQGKEVVVTREPGGTCLAEEIRKILLSEYAEPTLPKTELLLLYAGRLQHVEGIIKPALNAGKWVICDRFVDATFAYQGGGRGIPMALIENLNQWTLEGFKPDYTIILDAPVEVALGRIQSHRPLDRFEKEQWDFFERIRTVYMTRAQQSPRRYCRVDAAVPLLEVQQALHAILSKLTASPCLSL